MESLFKKLESGIQTAFGIMGIAMILIESYAVLARNVLKVTSAWTDETLKGLFVWTIFICSALAFLSDDLIGLNLVEEKLLQKKAFGAIKVVQYVFALFLGGFLTVQGVEIIQTQFITGECTAVMAYPLWIINAGFLIGAILSVVFAVHKIINCKKYFKKEE